MVAQAWIRFGAGQQRQQFRPSRKCGPGFGAVDQPATFRRGCRHGQPRHIRAEIRLGHGDAHHIVPVGQPGQVPLFLRFGASLEQGLGEYFRARDEAAENQRATGQFLGHHDHAQIVGLLLESPVSLGNRQPKAATCRISSSGIS